jgi:hypothetical protein
MVRAPEITQLLLPIASLPSPVGIETLIASASRS